MSEPKQDGEGWLWFGVWLMLTIIFVLNSWVTTNLERELEAARDSISVLTSTPDPCPETGRFTTPNGGTMIITLCTGEEDDTATTDRIPDPH